MQEAPTWIAVSGRWRPADPGLSSLRRAARTALVMPAVFAFAVLVLRDPQITIFVAFGCFALMVLADFGGTRRPRAVAYVVTTLIGAMLVAMGTLLSPTVGLAAAAMFAVAFCVQFATVFGGYAAAAQPALLLSFVLAASIPASPASIPERLAGWLIAGAVSTLAGVFLWPRFEQVHLRKRAAEVLRLLAALLAAHRAGAASDQLATSRQSARAAFQRLRQEYSGTAKRPAGPTRRDRAFVELLAELERALEFLDGPFGRNLSAPHPSRAEGDELGSEVVRTLARSGDVLTGGPPPDLLTLEQARAADRRALDGWAATTLHSGGSPEKVLEGLDTDHALRVMSYLALAMGTNAMLSAGHNPEAELPLPAGTPRQGPGRVLIRVGRTVRTHLAPTSSVLHNSLRTAVGLALAVLLARLLQLDHAFWVVLGTTSVLRTNALATGRTVMEALLGTLVGFAVGAVFTALVGTNTAVLWAALPITVFLAAYASTAISFLVGQAAFTVNVLILFNLITPVGWRLGFARIEDVAVGAGISVVAGLLLWPRGARRELSRSVASFYRAVAVFLASSFARLLADGTLEETARARLLAVRARDRAAEAYEQFLNERAVKRIDPETGAMLLAGGEHSMLVADALNVIADMGYRGGKCPQEVQELRATAEATRERLERLASRLERPVAPFQRPPEAPNELLRQAALGCLRRWRDDPDAGRSAVVVVLVSEWVEQLRGLTAALEKPVARTAQAGRVPWWR
jgi:uncharacterized membrane protein YccC